MKPWKQSLLATIAFIPALIIAGYIHTEVILADTITPERDIAISRAYGNVLGTGLLAIWGSLLLRKKPKQDHGEEEEPCSDAPDMD